MNNRGQMAKIGVIIMIFVTIIIGIALITPTFNTQNLLTDKQTETNQTVSVVSAYAGAQEANESKNFTIYSQSAWKQIDCPLTSVTIRSANGTALTVDDDYTLYADAGVFSLVNSSETVPAITKNITYVDYTFCDDGYNKDQGSRSMAGIIGLFAVLALVIGGILVGIRDWL